MAAGGRAAGGAKAVWVSAIAPEHVTRARNGRAWMLSWMRAELYAAATSVERDRVPLGEQTAQWAARAVPLFMYHKMLEMLERCADDDLGWWKDVVDVQVITTRRYVRASRAPYHDLAAQRADADYIAPTVAWFKSLVPARCVLVADFYTSGTKLALASQNVALQTRNGIRYVIHSYTQVRDGVTYTQLATPPTGAGAGAGTGAGAGAGAGM